MSTVDPERRWWRNARLLRIIAVVLWVIVFVVTFVTGWSNALYLVRGEWVHWAGADWLVGIGNVGEPVARIAETSLVIVMWPILIAGFVDAYARHRSGQGEAWCVASAFGWALLGLGFGTLVAALSAPVGWTWPVCFLLLGALALALKPVTRILVARYRERQSWSRMHGTPVIAVATKVDVTTINSIDRWQVTLRYDDQTGQTRWHKARIAFQAKVQPQKGNRYELRYDPEHPTRRSSIYVNLSRPKKVTHR